jgi:arabinofuranosyltransferase
VVLRPAGKHFWFLLSLVCALSLVNRLDTICIYLPTLIFILLSRFRSFDIRQCLLGSLPFIAWECFSLVYYGFLLPNTAYAKLASGIPEEVYITQGMHYFHNLLVVDPLGAFFLFTAILLPLVWIFIRDPRWPLQTTLSIGVLFYSLYVICVGGTFISGRFWSLPVFASIWLLYVSASPALKRIPCALALALVVVKISYPTPDELYASRSPAFAGWIHPTGKRIMLLQPHRKLRLPKMRTPKVIIWGELGMPGFKAGPNVHIIDQLALSDALLARLPSRYHKIGRIGHIARLIPAGYESAVRTGSLAKMNPYLAEYYKPLRFIISGPIWDQARLATIIEFNLGAYDYARDLYLRGY